MGNNYEHVVQCGTHGGVELVMICCHLFRQFEDPDPKPIQYYESESEIEDENSTDLRCVWCIDCDQILDREGELNDVSEGFADPHMVCEFCLLELLDNNEAGTSL